MGTGHPGRHECVRVAPSMRWMVPLNTGSGEGDGRSDGVAMGDADGWTEAEGDGDARVGPGEGGVELESSVGPHATSARHAPIRTIVTGPRISISCMFHSGCHPARAAT